MKNKKIGYAIGGIIVSVTVFYGGMVYGKSQVPTRGQGAAFGAGNFAGGVGGARGARAGGGGVTAGQIIAKDANSITVQLGNGGATQQPGGAVQGSGSKIIFLDSNSKVSKQTTGTITDLTVGTEVSVTGTTNSDGSINAQSVQIRPNMPVGAKVQ